MKHSKHGEAFNDAKDYKRNGLQLFDGRNSTFLHPFTVTVSRPTGSGKTYFVKSLLEKDKIKPAPDIILYLYRRWQPLYDKLKKSVLRLEFMQGIPESLDEESLFDPKKFFSMT